MVRLSPILLAGAALTVLSACASGYYGSYPDDTRRPWEVTAWASARPDGLYSVRTVTVAPDTCYAPGEIRSAPSSLPETIELQTSVIRSQYGPCQNYYTEIVHDLPAVRLEPDDRQIEIVVFADGGERNRIRLNVDQLQPIAGNYYPRYDPRDPRYVPPRS
jgi:hypothetical protein